jgi:hypothetical protein
MPSIKRRKKPKTRKIFHKYINQQDGGIKVMIGRTDDASDPNNNPLTRQVLTADLFSNVLNHVTNVDVISVSSLSSFVVTAHLPEEPALFRSDTIAQDDEYLQVGKIMDEKSGKIIRQIVLKICILKNNSGARTVTPTFTVSGRNHEKEAVSVLDFTNEYEIQRYLYSSMMSYSGNPFCPDAFGFLTIPAVNGLNIFDNIIARIQPNNRFHNIHTYLTSLYANNLFVGVILMDSIPSSYRSVRDFTPGHQLYNPAHYTNLSELILSIYILTIYRGKLFLLDAHSENWLCNPTASELSRVKAIDFGRVYRINSITSIQSLNRSINIDIRTFFNAVQRDNYRDPSVVLNLIVGLLTIMNVPIDRIAQYTDNRYVNLDTQYSHVVRVFQEHIQNVVDMFNTNTYFETKLSNLTPQERQQNLNMIHRLVVISCLMDGFFNYYKFAIPDRKAQFGHIVQGLFNTGVSTPIQIINHQIMFDLESMNTRPIYDNLLIKYANIYSYIVRYNSDRLYPTIRNYTEFRERQRSVAQNALISITPHIPQMFTTTGRVKKACVSGACMTGSLLGKATLGIGRFAGNTLYGLASLTAKPFVYVGEKAINSMRPKPQLPPGFKPPRVVAKSPPMYNGGRSGHRKKRRSTRKIKW